jgi:hypothetical protein
MRVLMVNRDMVLAKGGPLAHNCEVPVHNLSVLQIFRLKRA